jgi:hypothetical protein
VKQSNSKKRHERRDFPDPLPADYPSPFKAVQQYWSDPRRLEDSYGWEPSDHEMYTNMVLINLLV